MTGSLKVAALQLLCTGSRREVEERALELVEGAATRGAEIVCLPEHWLPGKTPDLRPSLPMLKQAAGRSKVCVIAGADFVEAEGPMTVESVVIDRDGKEVGRQKKTHLFGREKLVAQAGAKYRVFETGGVKFGVAICHDLVYPEVARILALKGAEVIFAPAKIGTTGIGPWHLYLKARALENRIPIVSPNVFAPPLYDGGSMIVGVLAKGSIIHPTVLARAGSRQRILYADLDLHAIKKHRDDRLRSRRPETYSGLLAPTSAGPVRVGPGGSGTFGR